MLNKTIVLIISLATTYSCQAQSCKTDLASIAYLLQFEQENLNSQNKIHFLQNTYTATLTKCICLIRKEELYNANINFARTERDLLLQEAHNSLKRNHNYIASEFIENASRWDRVIKELEKQEAQK